MTIYFLFNSFPGAGQSRSIVNDLARQISIDPEISAQLATMSQSTQSYLYAVSGPVKQDRHYAELNAAIDQKPSKTPHQHLQIKDSLVDQHARRPLSLNDLRPPPTSPPPPLPKNGKQHGYYRSCGSSQEYVFCKLGCPVFS